MATPTRPVPAGPPSCCPLLDQQQLAQGPPAAVLSLRSAPPQGAPCR
jgi:hypothetical protein